MSAITIYHNPRCSKSRETLALLESRGVTPVVIDYLQTPPTVAELTRIVHLLGGAARSLVRLKEAREEGIAVEALDEAGLIAALAAHPRAIERPIVVTETAARLGRPPEAVLDIL